MVTPTTVAPGSAGAGAACPQLHHVLPSRPVSQRPRDWWELLNSEVTRFTTAPWGRCVPQMTLLASRGAYRHLPGFGSHWHRGLG